MYDVLVVQTVQRRHELTHERPGVGLAQAALLLLLQVRAEVAARCVLQHETVERRRLQQRNVRRLVACGDRLLYCEYKWRSWQVTNVEENTEHNATSEGITTSVIENIP